MNYELIMLRNALHMKKSANKYLQEMKHIALTSYSTVNWRDGTFGQIEAMSRASQRREECLRFYDAVRDALLIIPSRYRALLVAVYLKNCDRQEIAKRYGVSLSTVYRKLLRARTHFLNALKSLGCDEKWFCDNYSEYDFEQHLSKVK